MATDLTGPAASATPPRSAPDRAANLRALGGLGFALTVIAQNLIRGASAPLNNATSADVIAHFGNDTATSLVLGLTFVAGAFCLTAFVGELIRRGGLRSAAALMGLLGAAMVMALFGTVVGLESALVAAAHRVTPNPGTVDALWLAHNAVFAVLGLALAVALTGLALTGVEAGLTPRVFRWLAPLGAVLLCVEAATSVVSADGRFLAGMFISLVGFLVWLGFLIATSLTMVRRA